MSEETPHTTPKKPLLKRLSAPFRYLGGKLDYNSPVILSFTLLSLIVLLADGITDCRSTALLFSVYRSSMADPLFYLRLFGHVLGHTDFSHYAANISLILLLGPIVEEKYGSLRLVAMILTTALATSIMFLIISPNMLLGASGIAFMLIFLAACTGRSNGKIPLTLILVVVIYLGGELADGVFLYDNVSQLTHIVGGVCGIALGMLIRKKKKPA